MRSIVLASSYPSANQTVRIGPSLPLSAAVRLAYTPLRILVENKEFDGLFVLAAMKAYASRENLRLWELHPPTGAVVDITHGGGTGDLQKEAIRLIQEARTNGLPARLIVMIDSDGRWPYEISEKAKGIAALCADASVECLILSCRAIENYIPDISFLLWIESPDQTSAKPQVEALLRLTAEQRDFFPMKGKKSKNRGMQAIDAADAPAAQKAVFAGVSAEDRRALTGFSDSIVLLLRDYLPSPAAAHLDSRDLRGDLRALVSSIEKAL